MTTATRAWLVASLLGVACSNAEPTPEADEPREAHSVVGEGSATSKSSATSSSTGSADPTTDASSNDASTASASPSSSDTGVGLPPIIRGSCIEGVPKTTQVPRLLNRQYDAALRDLLGITVLDTSLPPSASLAPDTSGELSDIAWNAYQSVAAQVAHNVISGPNKAKFISCDPADAGCLEATVKSFGRQAFRRSLTADEVTSLMRFDSLTPKGEPAEVAEAILYAILISPSFIMLPELAQDVDAASGAFKLAPNEVATRLALLLWGSVPDEALLKAADDNQLSTKDEILTQAQRMLAVKEKAGPLLVDYHRYYADIRSGAYWDTVDHDVDIYPNFDRSVIGPVMMAEVDRFFEEVALRGTFKDLFLSNVAFVNQDTAAIYALDPAAYGPELSAVELDANERPGFLTRVAFLSSFSHFDRTGPLLRGAFISHEVLGVQLVPMITSLPMLPEGMYLTNRDEMAALTSVGECAECHITQINPPGFVLESYDAIGAVQTRDPLGGDLNTTADVYLDGIPQTIHNALELMTAISRSDQAKHRYAEQWVTYSTNRAPNDYDVCTVEHVSEKLANDGYTIVQLLADLSQTDTFTLRSAEN